MISGQSKYMKLKQIILSILTFISILYVTLSLLGSWSQPQIQSRLELYQTNLILQASGWQPQTEDRANLLTLRDNIIGKDPVNAALKQYQNVQESNYQNLQRLQPNQPSQFSRGELAQTIGELELRIGIIQAVLGDSQKAIATWESLISENGNYPTSDTAEVLVGLWTEPPDIVADAEDILQANLEGWFSFQTLAQLYTLQNREDVLQQLNNQQQKTSENAVYKLAIVSAIPGFGLVSGIILSIILAVQWFLKREQAIINRNADVEWSVPWTAETIVQVFVLGFFLVGQLLIPLIFQLLGLRPAAGDVRLQAFYILITYMILVGGGLGVLYLSIKSFFPLPEGWFRFKLWDSWLLWGFGGYCVALPLVILTSLVNQRLWDGQGGSNPILPIALENRDPVALGIFFFTASIAAPWFEEVLFRGFLLPSLTRYFSLWGAIIASGLLFAVAHLNVSEILPLFVLGIVLGFVYTRSRNLWAPMLLHSLWNSGTLISLYILGSGAN